MLKSCPDAVDVVDLQFKLQCRLKVFENENVSLFSNTNSLLTCASRYGLLFVGSNSKHFQVIQTNTLQGFSPQDKEVVEYPRRTVLIPSLPRHLCVNCDSTILAVVTEKDQCPIAIFYEVLSFLQRDINIIKEVRLSPTPNVFVREINWNPSLPTVFTACKSDGSLGLYQLKGGSVDINELPVAAGASCFCWSPKGKQIAVGSMDGKITQYKPDLKAVKAIGEPKLNGPHTIISLQWASNYQFIGVYQSQGGASYIIVIDAPKTGNPVYTNYEDICYSGSSRPPQFYLIFQQTWNFLMVASANSAEVGVLGHSGETWTQWIMPDTARAELPLSPDHQETLPVGLTLDISSTISLPWGESTIPPCPLLCILSNYGVLCCFNVVYLNKGIPSICAPPDPVADTTGLGSFVTNAANRKNNLLEVIHQKSQEPGPKPAQTETNFGIANAQPHFGSTPLKTTPFPVSSAPLNVLSQSTPLISGKAADLTSKTLFGGQATLTPIKPHQGIQNTSLFIGNTSITPVSKGPNGTVSSTNISTRQSANLGEKFAPGFSSLNPTSRPQISTAPVKPIVVSAASAKPETTVKLQDESGPKPQQIEHDAQVMTPKDTTQRRSAITKPDNQTSVDAKAETSRILLEMIQDEWMYLESELKCLINMGYTFKASVGTDIEKVDMIEQIDSLQEFVKEAVDISAGQGNEIHCLKQNLIQSWAWLEEAKSHYIFFKNEAVALLIKLQPLDSLSQKRYKDIKQLIYYVDSQISQANKALDEQWDNFQDYAKKTYKVKMPTMETIFQTMVRQNAVLQKQTYILKDISLRLKRKSNINPMLFALDKDPDLTGHFQKLDPQDILQFQYAKIKNHTKNLSELKAKKLRDLLKQREITRVTAVKPRISSWAIDQSPASRMRQSISRLNNSMSALSKSSVARGIEFAQQAPPYKVFEATRAIRQAENLPFSVKAPEKPSTFVPLVKSGSVISSSQGSAFTPIGYAASSANKSDNQQIFFKTYGETVAPSNKIIPTASFPSQALTSTASSAKYKLNLGGDANSLFKSPSDAATVTSAPFKAGLSKTPATTSSSALTLKWISSNDGFHFSNTNSTSTNQLNKPAALVPNAVQSQNISSVQRTQQMLSEAVSTEAPSVTAASTPESTSGVTSIFSNLQPVTDKATTSPSTLPSSLSFSFTSSAAATASKAGSFLGIGSKSGADSTSAAQNIFGFSAVPPTNNASAIGKLAKLSESSEAFELKPTPAPNAAKCQPSTPTHAISVSLFDSQPIPRGAAKAIVDTSSIFGANTATASVSQPSSNIFSSVTSAATAEDTNNISAKPIAFGIPSVTSKLKSPTGPIVTTTTTQASIFGSSSSLFGSPVLSTTTSTSVFTGSAANASSPSASEGAISSSGSLFGSSAPSHTTASTAGIFTSPEVSEAGGHTSPLFEMYPLGLATTTSTSSNNNLFGNAIGVTSLASEETSRSLTLSTTTTTSGTSNIFGGGNTTDLTPSTSNKEMRIGGSIFGNNVAPSSGGGFLSPQTTPIFGGATTTKSIFGLPATTTTTTSIFGVPSTTTTTLTDQFDTPTTTTILSDFGTAAVTPPSSNSFDTSTNKTNIFGSPTTGSIFGAATTANIFAPPASGSSSIFGNSDATSSTGKVFGSPTLVTTTSSIFSSTPSTTAFGSRSGSVFGGSSTAGPAFGQPAAFGNETAFGGVQQATTASSVFGQPSVFDSGSQNAIFGSTTSVASTTSENIFSNTATGGFGTGFGATSTTSAFRSAAPTQAPLGSFGFGGLSVDGTFGSKPADTFPQTPAPNPFANVEAKPAFGSSSTNTFGSPSSTQTSIFGSGSGTTLFGGGSTTATGGVFGSSGAFAQKPAFGQPGPFGSNAFGGAQTGTFSGASTSPAAQSGFGSPASFQKPSGFGSPPVFGGPPAAAFSAAPTFGGAATFGSVPTFGNPEKVFGSTNPTAGGGFAAGAQQSAEFGSLASQNTVGFANLAQQANTPSSMPFSGNASFSSWR